MFISTETEIWKKTSSREAEPPSRGRRAASRRLEELS